MTGSPVSPNPLVDPLQLWKEGGADALVLRIHQNERPLLGLSGRVDWEFHGKLTRFFEAGFLSGAEGERALVALRHRNRRLQVLLCGSGPSAAPGERSRVDARSLEALAEQTRKIGSARWMISQSDFGGPLERGPGKPGKEERWIITS